MKKIYFIVGFLLIFSLNTYAQDSDGDGLDDATEIIIGTDKLDADTDNDGLLDGDEDANQNGVVI